MTKKAPPSDELLTPLFYKKRRKDRPTLERSSSWFSPSHIANAQRITMNDNDLTPRPEFEPLHRSPDVIASLNGDNFVPEKESSF